MRGVARAEAHRAWQAPAAPATTTTLPTALPFLAERPSIARARELRAALARFQSLHRRPARAARRRAHVACGRGAARDPPPTEARVMRSSMDRRRGAEPRPDCMPSQIATGELRCGARAHRRPLSPADIREGVGPARRVDLPRHLLPHGAAAASAL